LLRVHRGPRLTDQDTVVIADFADSTSRKIFASKVKASDPEMESKM